MSEEHPDYERAAPIAVRDVIRGMGFHADAGGRVVLLEHHHADFWTLTVTPETGEPASVLLRADEITKLTDCCRTLTIPVLAGGSAAAMEPVPGLVHTLMGMVGAAVASGALGFPPNAPAHDER